MSSAAYTKKFKDFAARSERQRSEILLFQAAHPVITGYNANARSSDGETPQASSLLSHQYSDLLTIAKG